MPGHFCYQLCLCQTEAAVGPPESARGLQGMSTRQTGQLPFLELRSFICNAEINILPLCGVNLRWKYTNPRRVPVIEPTG